MSDLASIEYLRQRLEPTPGDTFYLHLSDLLLAVRDIIPKNVDRVLDYGCGGSPYRPLFGSSCIYHRADLAGSSGDLDFEYGVDGRLAAASSDYDCLLSSQVLEHVDSPTLYLAECFRVLKSNGRLILSTHGLFEDHACPYDYWRWTVFGLRKLVEAAGFEVQQIRKATTGPRAAVFIAEREQHRMEFDNSGWYSRGLTYGTRIFRRAGARRLHEACDASFPQHRVVDANQGDRGHDIYIAIVLSARR